MVTVWSNTATVGWRDHNRLAWPLNGRLEEATAGGGPSDRGRRVGLPRELEGAADGGLAFPTDGGVISRERWGRWAADGGVILRAWWISFPANGGQRAWVSGNPASLSQRWSSGLESAAIRQAWVRGRPAGIESEAGRWALIQQRAGGLGLAMDGGVISCERWAGWSMNGGVNSHERRDGWAANGGVNYRERRDRWAANGGVNSRERRAWGLAASEILLVNLQILPKMMSLTEGWYH